MTITIGKQTFDTTPEQDSALQRESDQAMEGRGNDPQPSLEEFLIRQIITALDAKIGIAIAEQKEAVIQKIKSIDPKQLDAIATAIDSLAKS